MIKNDSFTDLASWVDIHAEHLRNLRLDGQRKVLLALVDKVMGDSIKLHSLESFEEQKRVRVANASRVSVKYTFEVSPNGFLNLFVGLHYFLQNVKPRVWLQLVLRYLGCENMGQALLQRIVV